MSKKTALIVLLLGLAILVFALVDPTDMGLMPSGGVDGTGTKGALGRWSPLRIGVLSAGALLGVLGAYGIAKKAPEKK